MSDQPETLAAILAEMRLDADILVFPTITPDKLRTYADRIEASAEREARTREQAAADYALKRGEDIHADRCRNCTARAPGNAAALREALMKCNEFFRCDDDNRPLLCNLARKADEATQAALASPARNCDVGTAQEQIDRFNEFCHSNRYYIDEFHGDDCRPDCPIGKIVDRDNKFCDNCWAAWAQMPFAPAEGGDHA